MAAPSYRTPLLWILLPMIAGYTLGHHLPGIAPLIAATTGIAALLVAARFLRSHPQSNAWSMIWPITFILGILLVSLAYYQKVYHTPEAWTQLPRREAFLNLKVKTHFLRHRSQSGQWNRRDNRGHNRTYRAWSVTNCTFQFTTKVNLSTAAPD